jgi:hypothetical protein
MRELTSLQSRILLFGAILMVVGAGCCAFLFKSAIFCFVYAVGAVLFVAMQLQQRYEGDDVVVRRLRRILIFSDILFLLAAVSIVDTQYYFLSSLMSRVDYITYVYNKWVMLLLCGAILQMYATHRISHELSKGSSQNKH